MGETWGEGCVECGFSGYCDGGTRVNPPNLDCSAPKTLDPPPEPDLYGREICGLEKVFSGVCDRRNIDWSSGDGRAGAVGGDIAAALDVGAEPKIEDAEGRENSADPGSLEGRSGSDPSMAEIDMLLPGRFGWLLGASRPSRDGGAFTDCDREPYT